MKKHLVQVAILAFALFIFNPAQAASININSPEWLGSLKLDKKQLKEIKKAVNNALTAPIDAEQQCGAVRLDCVVRAAREWEFQGNKFREIVVHIHTIGHSSVAVQQSKGKWPKVVAK